MLTLTVDTVFGSALSPLSVNMILFTVTGMISPIIVNVYTNGSVYIYGCYSAGTNSNQLLPIPMLLPVSKVYLQFIYIIIMWPSK